MCQVGFQCPQRDTTASVYFFPKNFQFPKLSVLLQNRAVPHMCASEGFLVSVGLMAGSGWDVGVSWDRRCCEPIGALHSGVALSSYFGKRRLKLQGLWRADEGSGK